MSRDIAPFGVRMPPDLRSKVEEAARKSGRSLNLEVVERLNRSFELDDAGVGTTDHATEIAELKRRLAVVEKKLAAKPARKRKA